MFNTAAFIQKHKLFVFSCRLEAYECELICKTATSMYARIISYGGRGNNFLFQINLMMMIMLIGDLGGFFMTFTLSACKVYSIILKTYIFMLKVAPKLYFYYLLLSKLSVIFFHVCHLSKKEKKIEG